MNKLADLTLDLDEYNERTAAEITKRTTLKRDLFLVAIFFLVASVVALFFDAPIVAGALFLVSILFKEGAFETRLEISMIEANWWLALLINKHTRDLEVLRLREELKQERDSESS